MSIWGIDGPELGKVIVTEGILGFLTSGVAGRDAGRVYHTGYHEDDRKLKTRPPMLVCNFLSC